jgi:hypothetical protein
MNEFSKAAYGVDIWVSLQPAQKPKREGHQKKTKKDLPPLNRLFLYTK